MNWMRMSNYSLASNLPFLLISMEIQKCECYIMLLKYIQEEMDFVVLLTYCWWFSELFPTSKGVCTLAPNLRESSHGPVAKQNLVPRQHNIRVHGLNHKRYLKFDCYQTCPRSCCLLSNHMPVFYRRRQNDNNCPKKLPPKINCWLDQLLMNHTLDSTNRPYLIYFYI